jgi:TetR/AcrR family transcriptional regulator
MPSPRRLGLKTSATRTALIEAATQLIREEGHKALSSRRVAEKAGLKPQLVHYYFRTIDDLAIAVLQRSGDEVLKRAARSVTSAEPMRALWELATDMKAALFTIEVVAMASHHEAIREEAIRYGAQYRTITAEAIARYLELRGIAPGLSPMAVTMIITAVGGMLMREKALGMSVGHQELENLIEAWLAAFTTKDKPASPSRPRAQARRRSKNSR